MPPPPLAPVQFSAEKLSSVQGFKCTSNPPKEYEQRVEDFLKGPGDKNSHTALRFLKERGWRTTLYESDAGVLVGYGTICKDKWVIDGKETKLAHLAAFGVDVNFQGKERNPEDPNDYSWLYSRRIMADLQSRAEDFKLTIWALRVSLENQAGIRFFERWGFNPVKGQDNPRSYLQMARTF
jgi:ribosomal protein S18 acetylase RimI-like enzyme